MSDRFDSLKADIPLPQDVYALAGLFAAHDFSLFAVGGVNRDYLYAEFHGGKFSPKDVDLATDAMPWEVSRVLNSDAGKKLGVRSFPKGEAFGVISAILNGVEYEIATFREEWYDPDKGDGRRPDQVSYTTAARDAARRDLTMNALFFDLQAKELRDYNLDARGLGQGFDDIRNLVARPVGNARDRFREDKLRIPRLVRFFSRFSDGKILDKLDPDTLAAVDEFKDLKGVSPERVANEFTVGLAKAKNPVSYFENYEALGLLPAVFGSKIRMPHNGYGLLPDCRNLKAVLAWLCRNNDPGVARQALNDLKYSNDVTDRVAFLMKFWQQDHAKIGQMLKQRDLYKQLKDDDVREAARAELFQDVRDYARLSRVVEVEYFLNYEPVAKAADFMHLQGKAISEAMALLESQVYLDGLVAQKRV